jgi:hypothetical protein
MSDQVQGRSKAPPLPFGKRDIKGAPPVRCRKRLRNQTLGAFYFGVEQEKFAASSVLPVPLYVATCG